MCIGCVLWASNFAESIIHLPLREQLPKIPETNDKLWGPIRRKSAESMVKEKVFGKKFITLSAWSVGLVTLGLVLVVIPKDVHRLREIMARRAEEAV
jgi:hypothetical protein